MSATLITGRPVFADKAQFVPMFLEVITAIALLVSPVIRSDTVKMSTNAIDDSVRLASVAKVPPVPTL